MRNEQKELEDFLEKQRRHQNIEKRGGSLHKKMTKDSFKTIPMQ